MFVLKYKKELYRVWEVAKLFHVHPATVRYWADHKKLPYVRTLDGERRFPIEGLIQAGASYNFYL